MPCQVGWVRLRVQHGHYPSNLLSTLHGISEHQHSHCYHPRHYLGAPHRRSRSQAVTVAGCSQSLRPAERSGQGACRRLQHGSRGPRPRGDVAARRGAVADAEKVLLGAAAVRAAYRVNVVNRAPFAAALSTLCTLAATPWQCGSAWRGVAAPGGPRTASRSSRWRPAAPPAPWWNGERQAGTDMLWLRGELTRSMPYAMLPAPAG